MAKIAIFIKRDGKGNIESIYSAGLSGGPVTIEEIYVQNGEKGPVRDISAAFEYDEAQVYNARQRWEDRK